jgi:hypothetical protein
MMMFFVIVKYVRHPAEGRDPYGCMLEVEKTWIPAFAGMTSVRVL